LETRLSHKAAEPPGGLHIMGHHGRHRAHGGQGLAAQKPPFEILALGDVDDGGQEVGVELEAIDPAELLVDGLLVALPLLAVLVVEDVERPARRVAVEPIEPSA